MKYYIIAGEASGDLHGSNLVFELRKLDATATIRCWGGDKMQAAGATVVKHYRELAFMGFAEVIMNLPTILRNLKFCKKDILAYKPDVLILVDYPGFNLRIAAWAKKQGFKVIFYVSPQVWAWKENRVKSMKKNIDKLIVILPFEKEYYKNKWNWDVEYPGHPLVAEIEKRKTEIQDLPGLKFSPKPIIALLPGSRKQEILKKLPVMLEASRSFPGYQFIIAKAPGLESVFYDDIIRGYDDVSYVVDKTYPLLMQSKAALVTSGTATLETALFDVPEVVCYKASWLSYQIGKRLIKVKYISLVNLIMDKEVVKELIQDDLTVTNLKKELQKILNDESKLEQIKIDYQALRRLLAVGGNASMKAAIIIFDQVSSWRSSKPAI